MQMKSRRNALLALTMSLTPAVASATTLADAIAAVRAGNPDIAAGRADAAAGAAQVRIERAPARPKVQASIVGLQGTEGANVASGFDRTFDSNVSIGLPLYDGGVVHQRVRAARQRLAGANAEAAATENEVVAQAITAYLDVLRDRAIVALTQENIALLQRDLAANRERFREGDVTRTDLSQTEARRALALGRVADAEARLDASVATYRRLVGADPDALEPPPPLPDLAIHGAAIGETAATHNPAVTAAEANAAAARTAIRATRASGRPTLNVTGGGEYHNYAQSPVGYRPVRGGGAEVSSTLGYSLYEGGRVSAQVAQARAAADKADAQLEARRRRVSAEARAALARYRASLRTVAETEQAVAFERDALKGVRIEGKAGERTVLEVLNANLELLDSQIALANARRDSYAAGVGVIAAVDRLPCFDTPGVATCSVVLR